MPRSHCSVVLMIPPLMLAMTAHVMAAEDRGTAPVQGPVCESAEACALVGGFTPPFEEPTIGGEFPDQNNTTVENPLNKYPENGRCEENADGVLKCKPAAGSMALLGDGRILYFNALEGTENVEFSVAFEGGHAIINDQTRVMTIGRERADWIGPDDVRGGANPDGYESTALVGDRIGFDVDSIDERTNNDGALFCADVVGLANGEIMAIGGTDYYAEPGIDTEVMGRPFNFGVVELEGLRNSRIFNPATNGWRKTGDMNYGRWYPSALSLANGDVFVASGVTKLIKPIYPENPETSGRNVLQTETYSLATGLWTENGPSAERSLPLYPRLHLLPNGHVLYNAAGQSFNPFGQSYDQALWNIVAAYDPTRRTWSDLAYAGLPLRMNEVGAAALTSFLNPTSPEQEANLQRMMSEVQDSLVQDPSRLAAPFAEDPGKLANLASALGAGFRGSTFSLMLPLVPNEAGEYKQVDILTAGGVLGGVALSSPGGYFGTNLSRIDTIHLDGEKMLYESRLSGLLNKPRWYGTGVLLPTGEVLVVSGADRDEVIAPGTATPILEAELFDPATETFRVVARQHRARTYHNSALLLPDGRVLIGGHAPINTAYAYSVTLPGFSPNDGRDPSFEIYSPPYMFRPRPELVGAPNTGTLGSTFTVRVNQGSLNKMGSNAQIESVVLVRRTDLTHLIDGDQRTVQLRILSNGGNVATVQMPSNAAVLPAGKYMLFVNARAEAGERTPSESVPFDVPLGR